MSFTSSALILYPWVTRPCWNYFCDCLIFCANFTRANVYFNAGNIICTTFIHSLVYELCVSLGIVAYISCLGILPRCLLALYVFFYMWWVLHCWVIMLVLSGFISFTPSFKYFQSEQVLLNPASYHDLLVMPFLWPHVSWYRLPTKLCTSMCLCLVLWCLRLFAASWRWPEPCQAAMVQFFFPVTIFSPFSTWCIVGEK